MRKICIRWTKRLICCLFVILVGVTPACSLTETTQVSQASDITLRVWFSSFEAENAEMREIAAEFTKLTGVSVEVFSSNFFDILSRFPNAAETDQRPDIVFMQSTDAGSLIESGYLMPADFLPGDIHDRSDAVAIEGFSYKGVQYGLGYSVDPYGLLYNKALIETPPDTWEEFYLLAEELMIRDNGEITQWGLLLNATNMWFTYPLLKHYGGYYFGRDEQGNFTPSDLGLNSPGMIAGLEKLRELQAKGMTLENRNQSDSHVVSRFARGGVAMTYYGLWNAELFHNNGIDFGLAQLPADENGVRSQPLASVQGFVINRFTRYPNEAQAFFRYIFEDGNQQRLYEAANGGDSKTGVRNTTNIAVANSDYVRESEILTALYELGRQSEIFPSNPEGPLIWNYALSVMHSIFYSTGDEADIKSHMDEFQARIEQDITDMRRELTATASDSLFYTIVLIAAALLLIVFIILRFLKRRRSEFVRKNSIRMTLLSLGLLVPILCMLCIFYLYPIVDNVNLSMTNYSNLNMRDYSYIGLDNYRVIFSSGLDGFLGMLIWTIFFALSVVAISFLAGVFLAVILDRQGIRIAKIYRVIFILPWAVPSIIALLMWQGLLDAHDGLVNSLLGIVGIGPVPFLVNPTWARLSSVLVMCWFSFPYYLTVSQGIISNIPRDYYEAMHIDGAGATVCFFRITIPTVIRAIMPALLMGFIMQFNQFGVYMLTGGGPAGETLGAPGATDLLITFVFRTAFITHRYGLAAAYSVLIFVFVGAFALLTMWLTRRKEAIASEL